MCSYSSEQQRRDAVAVWNHHYSYHRPHTTCGNQPPSTRHQRHDLIQLQPASTLLRNLYACAVSGGAGAIGAAAVRCLDLSDHGGLCASIRVRIGAR